LIGENNLAKRTIANDRVGERTPAKIRVKGAGIPLFWDTCDAADNFRQTIMTPSGEFQSLRYRRRLEQPDSTGRLKSFAEKGTRSWSPNSPSSVLTCSVATELTNRGRQTTLALGQRIRKLYVDQLKFLPKTLDDEDTVYIRYALYPRKLNLGRRIHVGL
jgi:acid phosphatase